MLRSSVLAIVTTFAALSAATPAEAAPGHLDRSYGDSGLAVNQLPGWSEGVADLALDPSRRAVIVGGVSRFDPGTITLQRDVIVRRLRPDGSSDPTFGSGGLVRTDISGRYEAASSVAMSRSKIVVAGLSTVPALPIESLFVVRYRADGSLDPAFGGGDGVAMVPAGGTGAGVIVDASGAITVSGGDKVVRLRVNGTLDPSFGVSGIVTLVPTGLGSAGGQAIAAGPHGRVVVAGHSGRDLAVWALTADGRLDPAFGGGDGVVTSSPSEHSSQANAVAVLGTGRIVVAGQFCDEPPPASDEKCDGGLARYNADGTPDTRFGVGGFRQQDMGALFESFTDLAVRPDGSLVVTGWTTVPGESMDLAVCYFTRSGALDSAGGGLVTTDIAGVVDQATGLVLDATGRALVAGDAGIGDGTFASVVARYRR